MYSTFMTIFNWIFWITIGIFVGVIVQAFMYHPLMGSFAGFIFFLIIMMVAVTDYFFSNRFKEQSKKSLKDIFKQKIVDTPFENN